MKPNLLKAEIIRNGMTMQEFAAKIGMKKTTLWRKLANRGIFSMAEAEKIAQVLNLDMNQIWAIFFTK